MNRSLLFWIALAVGTMPLLAEEVTIYRPQADSTSAPAPATPAPVVPAASPVPKAAVPSPSATPAAASSTYIVQKGDSLWKISKTTHVSVAALKETNHLTGDDIKVGSTLKLPTPAKEEVRKAEPALIAPASSPTPVSTPAPASSAPPKAVPVAAPAVSTPHASVNGYTPQEVALQKKFVAETKELALAGIGYDRSWRPPGEEASWDMDCSNTTRYLYKKVAGITIERTASDQYYYLQQKGRAWDAPLAPDGVPDEEALASKLEIGDLLFWQNTYKPQRDPPITHVMIYLGKNKEGQWLMAGSQMGGGFFNVSGSGPDVYVFKPKRRIGGFYTNLGFSHVTGQFIAYGRPIADKAAVLQLANR